MATMKKKPKKSAPMKKMAKAAPKQAPKPTPKARAAAPSTRGVVMSYADQLVHMEKFTLKTLEAFTEADSTYAPTAEMMSVAQQTLHLAQCVEWFVTGAFAKKGMTMDFTDHAKEIATCRSLTAAKQRLRNVIKSCARTLAKKTAADMAVAIVGPVMTGEARTAIMRGVWDHSAHHRGSLAVYARLLGRTPPMPYM